MRMSSNKLSLVGLKRIVAVFMCVIHKRVCENLMSLSCCEPYDGINVTPVIARCFERTIITTVRKSLRKI